jgi:MFS family permease
VSELPIRPLVGAVTSTTLASLPVFLVGGLAVLMTTDLGFDEEGLGIAVAAFYGTSAILSIPGGRLAERVGARRLTLAANGMTALCMLAIAVVATTWAHLVGLLVLAGVSNGMTQPSINLGLARLIPYTRQGLAFGIKQAAIPLATLISGLSLPLVGLTLGWRWGFALGVPILVVVIVAVVGSTPARAATGPSGGGAYGDGGAPRASLLLLATSAGLGAGAANCLGAFLVASLVSGGLTEGLAGLLFAVGSVVGVATRLGIGWHADLRGRGHLLVVAALMVAGGAGYLLISIAAGTLVTFVGIVLAFSGGWGWAGLLTFAIVRHHQEAPAAATGIQQAGVFVGGVVGPLLFGAVVVRTSYLVAWLMAGAMSLASAALVQRARVLIRRHHDANAPAPER